MNAIKLETIQYRTLADIDDVPPIDDKDYQVLAEIREVIARQNYFDRFGVALLHRHFDLRQDEILVEKTDVAGRTLTLSVVPASSVSDDTIETQWRFDRGPEAITKCVLRCDYFLGHKQKHKKERH